jgi:hypothetical protein
LRGKAHRAAAAAAAHQSYAVTLSGNAAAPAGHNSGAAASTWSTWCGVCGKDVGSAKDLAAHLLGKPHRAALERAAAAGGGEAAAANGGEDDDAGGVEWAEAGSAKKRRKGGGKRKGGR